MERILLTIFEKCVSAFVHELFHMSAIPKGSKTSVITLILNVGNFLFLMDYIHISLIGFQYKAITNVLDNSFAKVV